MIGYFVFNIILLLQLVLLAQTTDLVGGYGGRVGVASVLFAAIGGYAYATSTITIGIGPWKSVALALMATLAIGLFIGWLFLQLRENDFLLATLAGQLGFLEIANNIRILGGPLGIRGIPAPTLGPVLSDSALQAIWLVLPAVIICSIALVKLFGPYARFGSLIRWVRDDELSAHAFGLPVERLQIAIFLFLSFFSGIVGMGIVVAQSYVSPNTFDLWLSITVLTVVYISGTGGNPLWMFAGATILVLINEGLRSLGSFPELVGPLQQITLNVILVAILIFRRRGIAGPEIEFGPSANRLE